MPYTRFRTRCSASHTCRNWPPLAISTTPSTSAYFAANGQERTGTIVRQLEGDERLDELTQMLGASGSSGRRSVEEMMGEVGQVKAGKQVLK